MQVNIGFDDGEDEDNISPGNEKGVNIARENDTVRIFTDGSAINNGKANALAGIGIYFPDGQAPSMSLPYCGSHLSVDPATGFLVPLAGPNGPAGDGPEGVGKEAFGLHWEKPTNQRAELEAIRVAVEVAIQTPGYVPRKTIIQIFTDSEYCIQSLTNWGYNWMANGWKTSAGKAVKNRDIIEPLFGLFPRHKVLFVHTPSHTAKLDERSRGNAIADQLATRATAEQASLRGTTSGKRSRPNQRMRAKKRAKPTLVVE